MSHEMDSHLRSISISISKLESAYKLDKSGELICDMLNEIQTTIQKIKLISDNKTQIDDDPYLKGNILTMKKLSFRLWNLSIECDSLSPLDLVKMKELSCVLLLESILFSSPQLNLDSVATFIKFSASTGKRYIDIQDMTSAIRCWKLANDIWFKFFETDNNLSLHSKMYLDILSSLFYINCWYSESNLNMNNYKEARNTLKNAQKFFQLSSGLTSDDDSKLMLMDLVTLLYNLGVNRYKEKDYQDTILLLEEAVTLIDEKNISYDKEKHSKILRLISNAYINLFEKSNEDSANRYSLLDKSFRYIEMANRILETIYGKYLLLKLLILTRNSEDLEKEFMNMMNDSTIHFDMYSAIIALMTEYKQIEHAVKGYNILLKKYTNSPYIDKVYCMYIDFLINVKSDLEEARIQIDKIILENQSSTKPKTLTISSSRQLHFHTWQIAIEFYQSQKYLKAIEWFKRALDVISILNDDSCNKSQTLRMIALSALKVDDINLALTYANLAKSEEPDSIATLILLFEIYLTTDDEEKLNELVESFSLLECLDQNDEKINPLSVLSQKALEKGKLSLAEKIFNSLISSENIDQYRFRTIFRNAIKLVLSQQCSSELISYSQKLKNWLNIGVRYIKKIGVSSYFCNRPKMIDELKWFYGLAWNSATRLKETNSYELMHSLFHSSYQFCKFINELEPHYNENLICLRDSLLLSTSSLLLQEKNKSNTNILVNIMDKIMIRLNKCKILNAQINDLVSNNLLGVKVIDAFENIELLIIQVKMLRRDKDILSYFHTIQDKLSCNAFEIIASLALENTSLTLHREIGTDALKKCIELYRSELNSNEKSMDHLVLILTKLLATYRRLIVLSSSKQDSYQIFETVIEIIKKYESLIHLKSHNISTNLDKEIQWMVIEAFNNGVYYWKLSNYNLSEKWITRSLTINQYFCRKSELEPKIISAYSDVLAKKKDMMEVEKIIEV